MGTTLSFKTAKITSDKPREGEEGPQPRPPKLGRQARRPQGHALRSLQGAVSPLTSHDCPSQDPLCHPHQHSVAARPPGTCGLEATLSVSQVHRKDLPAHEAGIHLPGK